MSIKGLLHVNIENTNCFNSNNMDKMLCFLRYRSTGS